MSMLFGGEFYKEDFGKSDWVEKKKQELMDDSSLFGMHWRDFDQEAEDAWKNKERNDD